MQGDFSDAELRKMKGALGALEPADIDKIPDASFTIDVLKDFEEAFSSEDNPKKSLKSKIVDKVRKLRSCSYLSSGKYMFDDNTEVLIFK